MEVLRLLLLARMSKGVCQPDILGKGNHYTHRWMFLGFFTGLGFGTQIRKYTI
jgi:hypothetical protein